MKIKVVVLSLFVAGLGASYALADNGKPKHGSSEATSTSTSTTQTTTREHGKGKPQNPGVCKPVVSFVLNGTFVAAGADGSSFSMAVTHANRFGKTLGATPTVTTDAKTRIRRLGKPATLADLQAGDRLNVQLRGCKNAPAGTTPSVVATRVFARAAHAAPTTTDTTTTTP